MLKDIKNDFDFYQFIATEENCRKYLALKRWDGQEPQCPKCKKPGVYKFSDGNRYKCKSCSYIFKITTGTIFENSKIPLQKWFYAIYIYAGMGESLPANKLKRRLGVSYSTALFMHHRIMELFKLTNEKLKAAVEGVFEVDGLGIGADGKKMNKKTRRKKGNISGHGHRITILGCLCRGKFVYAFVTRPYADYLGVSGALSFASEDSTVYADSAPENARLVKNFVTVEFLNHQSKDYGCSIRTTNNIERAFRSFRAGLNRYVRTREAYIQRYANEQAFFYTMKTLQKKTDIESFEEAFKNVNNRITFNELRFFGMRSEILITDNAVAQDIMRKYLASNRFSAFMEKKTIRGKT